jgi:hypothetical protein
MEPTVLTAHLDEWLSGTADPAPDPATLPLPWAMSIRELDSWHRHYAARDGHGPALSNVERRHRAEIDRNIHLRHEARRHSAYP